MDFLFKCCINRQEYQIPMNLGDVNLDGIVDLLDVAPFVDLVATGTFQAEADADQNGVAKLLDVEPFFEILNGN